MTDRRDRSPTDSGGGRPLDEPDAPDYESRSYLSVVEVAHYTGLPVREIHRRAKSGQLRAFKSASGQYRFDLAHIELLRRNDYATVVNQSPDNVVVIEKGTTRQLIVQGDSRDMSGCIASDSVHLAITSPPYFNAKMYSESLSDLGNLHALDVWLVEIGKVWAEIYRILQPGRKFFLNIMNLPVRENKTFRSLNLVGRNIDLCENIGFVFKRDIIWHKTNGVRAHFGTYPYPGGILLNHMHEFILEFEKPNDRSGSKYKHVDTEQRESSRLDKDFWLSIKNSDVWLMKPQKSGGRRSHAAPFPLELPSRLIRAYSFVGETVVDPFLGSGTTLQAAALLGRNGIGCDINPEFCEMAEDNLRSTIL